MTSHQIISKILVTKSIDILDDANGINSVEYFRQYEDEYNFIVKHYEKYGNIPDKETFIKTFPTFSIANVTEPDIYLINELKNERITDELIPILNDAINLVNEDKAKDAIDLLVGKLQDVEVTSEFNAEDVFETAPDRLKILEDKFDNGEQYFLTTGFKELDDILGGYYRGEELFLWYARLGNGKSFTLLKSLVASALSGERVGVISPEMSAEKIGFRVDTLISHTSNSGLVRGKSDLVDIDQYKKHIEDIKDLRGLIVSTPKDFDNNITVSKLRRYVKQHKLTMLAIDGIMYLKDERSQKGNTKTLELGNIVQDLKSMSDELKIPIIIVHQANRGGEKSKGDEDNLNDMPDIVNISHSDAIAQSCTKIVVLKHDDEKLIMKVQKNRDDQSGQRLTYLWDADRGYYKSIATSGTEFDDSFVALNKQKFKIIEGNKTDNVF